MVRGVVLSAGVGIGVAYQQLTDAFAELLGALGAAGDADDRSGTLCAACQSGPVLERQRQARAELRHLAVLDLDVELGHFGAALIKFVVRRRLACGSNSSCPASGNECLLLKSTSVRNESPAR